MRSIGHLGSECMSNHQLFRRAVALSLALTAITGGGTAWSRDLGPSERQVYVFASSSADGGAFYRLDVAAKRQVLAPTIDGRATASYPLVDCGSADWYCVTSDRHGLAFIAPRLCADPRASPQVGDVWRYAGQKLVVLQRRDPEKRPSGERGGAPQIAADADISSMLLLGNPSRPDTVYEYALSRGIVGVFLRRSPRGPSPYEEARAGRLSRTAEPERAAIYRWLLPVAPLVPTDLARCRAAQ
jgi:hypothetical protein